MKTNTSVNSWLTYIANSDETNGYGLKRTKGTFEFNPYDGVLTFKPEGNFRPKSFKVDGDKFTEL